MRRLIFLVALCAAAPLSARPWDDQVAEATQRNFAEFLERVRTRALAEGRQHTLVVTDTAPERVLRSFLLSRRA